MKGVAVMVAAGFGSWLVASLVLGSRVRLELLCGMIGPLAGVSGSWVLVERTHRRNPQAVTSVMIAAFGLKLLFFGAYVAVMLVGCVPKGRYDEALAEGERLRSEVEQYSGEATPDETPPGRTLDR